MDVDCNFCGKSNYEVRVMINGPKGEIICCECVAVCAEVIAEYEAELERKSREVPMTPMMEAQIGGQGYSLWSGYASYR